MYLDFISIIQRLLILIELFITKIQTFEIRYYILSAVALHSGLYI